MEHDIGHGTAAGWEISRSALLQCRRVQCGQIGLGFFDALRRSLLEPRARLRRVWLAGGAFGEVAAEHQLSVPVTQLGGGAKPALRGRRVCGEVVTAGMERAQCEHCAAVSFCSSNTAPISRMIAASRRAIRKPPESLDAWAAYQRDRPLTSNAG